MKNFEELLQIELNKLPYENHLDDGQFNDGVQNGFEQGARWALSLFAVSESVEPVGEGTVCCETCKFYPPIGLNKEPCNDCIEFDEWEQQPGR